MATNKTVRGLSRAGFRVPGATTAASQKVDSTATKLVDVDDPFVAMRLSAEKHNFIRMDELKGNLTSISNADPAVFTKTGHGFDIDDVITLSTTGVLPTGLTVGQKYYVITAGLGADTFRVSATRNGTVIATTGAGSGTHTVTPASAPIIGLSRFGFRVKNTAGATVQVKIGSGATIVDLTDYKTLRTLRRNPGMFIVGENPAAVVVRGLLDAQLGISFTGAPNTDILTSTNVDVTAGKIVTIGTRPYTFVAALTEAYATAVLTGGAGNDIVAATPTSIILTIDVATDVSDGETVTIGDITYRFKDTMAAINDVKRHGTTTATTLDNLIAAINGTGSAGVEWFAGTVANPKVTAGTQAAHAVTLTAINHAVAGSTLAATETSNRLDFAGAGTTFAAGTARVAGDIVTLGDVAYEFYTSVTGLNNVANRILKGASDDTSLDRLIAAVNGTGASAKYSAATVANPKVSAADRVVHAVTFSARSKVAATGNAVAKVETSSNLDFDGSGAVFTGGVDPIADEVKIDGTADGSLGNLAAAINAGAGVGTVYSTGTTANANVTASAVGVPAAHKVTLTAVGGGSQTIPMTTNEVTLSFSGAALTDDLVTVYTGTTATLDVTDPDVYKSLRRNYRRWIEG